MIAIELNDAGLLIARGDAVLAESPGVAVVDAAEISVGEDARRRARLKPRSVVNTYWQQLNTDPLGLPGDAAPSHADLAYAQLVALRQALDPEDAEVIFAVPASLTREQLGLLLGVAREAMFTVAGVVDAAVVAVAREGPADHRRILHLDTHLHHSLITRLEARAGLTVTGFGLLPDLGTLRFETRIAEHIARVFLETSRFDPFHSAPTEQALYDQITACVAQAGIEGQGQLELNSGEHQYHITCHRQDLEAAVAALRDQITTRIATEELPAALYLSARTAELPGLADALALIDGLEVTVLPRGNAALGALEFRDRIAPAGASPRHVASLPLPAAPQGPVDEADERRSPLPRPTHVLYRNIAYPLAPTPLIVGRTPPGENGIRLICDPRGVSRRHCALSLEGDGVLATDLSRYGTLVNGVSIQGQTLLRTGDRLRIGNGGEELLIIATAPGHGT